MAFRSQLKAIDKEKLRWFPGHMEKGLKQMQHKLRSIDLIVEVHDARIPFSGRNTDFKHRLSGIKPHILVLNKVDLIDKSLVNRITSKLRDDYEHVLYTNCKDQTCKGVKQLFPLAQTLISNSDRYNRENADDYSVMIIGVPNVGKSSLVNTLRNRIMHRGNASPVGSAPGVTRSVQTRVKICDQPKFYMLDTPGVLTPRVGDAEEGLKLALCNCIKDHLVGESMIAEYLLYWLNAHDCLDYVKVFELERPTEDVLEVLAQIAVKQKKMLKFRDANGYYVQRPDISSASQHMIRAFRSGALGKLMLDLERL